MAREEPSDDHVELCFAPRWTYISCVRKFLASFFLIGLSDKEQAEQISTAASELLENAVKYSSEDDSYTRVEISRGRNEVHLVVENPADPEQINVLRREFALVTAGEPEAVYLKRMEEAARAGTQSRLGLIRILYEAGASLRLEVHEREVKMHAVFPVKEA